MSQPSTNVKAGPVEIKRGNVIVRIYTCNNKVGDKVYPQFALVYYDGAKRVRRRFNDIEEARREGEIAATRLANGENEVLRLTSIDRALYVQALDLLKPFNRPLNMAVQEYVEALGLLPAGASLRDAAADFAKRQRAVRESKTVREVVEEFLRRKRDGGRSAYHLGDLRSRLGHVAQAFEIPIASLTGKLVEAYLEGRRDLTARSKFNVLRHVKSVARFAVAQKYAPPDLLDELNTVERPTVPPTETEIFTPSELREMLASVRDELKPWLAIGAFCGLRSVEILRLDWAQVNLQRRFVEVKAINAKTQSRRLVGICDAAHAWLAPYAKPQGRLAHYTEENKFHAGVVTDVNRARRAAAEAVGHDPKSVPKFRWKRNGLRHSFCSYRLMLTHDAARTALEAGNSPAMVFKHYRELVTEEEAKQWFAVAPESKDGIIPMPAAAANQ